MNDDVAPGPWRLSLGLILATGAGLRFASLLSLPIFNDETIYAIWARSILGGGAWLISLTDGKQPLFYWLAAFMTGLVDDPLLGLRVTAALAGLAGIIGVYIAGTAVSDRRAGRAAAWVYAVVPYMVMNDRLGLADGLVAAIGPYTFWAAIRLGRAPTRSRTATLAAVLAMGLLAKTTAVMFILAAVLGIGIGRQQASGKRVDAGGAVNGAAGTTVMAVKGLVALVVALIPTAAILAFAPGGTFMVAKSSSFLLTMGELSSAPYTRWSANLGLLSHWLINYLQWPSLVLIGGALAVGGHRLKGRILVVLAAGAGPLAFMALAARTWFSRYAVMALPFVVLAVGLAYAALLEAVPSSRLKRMLPSLIIVVVTIVALGQDSLLIKAPTRFAWAADDRWQYIEGWPSGYGFDSVLSYIRGRAEATSNLTVFVDNNMGFPKDGLLLGLRQSKKLKVVPLPGNKPLRALVDRHRPVYLYVLDKPRLPGVQFLPMNPGWSKVAVFSKPGNASSFRVFEFKGGQK